MFDGLEPGFSTFARRVDIFSKSLARPRTRSLSFIIGMQISSPDVFAGGWRGVFEVPNRLLAFPELELDFDDGDVAGARVVCFPEPFRASFNS